ncbi:cell division protein FtsZ, partial [Candidatus Woesearchaeota archaeon]|nr:cell division protein FtsZ [Candidatus Woesearchaeota archaeon]
GEMITEALDADANVIWGARIANDLAGKLRVMTIVTGVTSPYILGKRTPGRPSAEAARISEELGIDLIR